jgi:molybdopterin converting factor small subunit
VKVKIPTPLFSYTANKASVEASGATIDQVTHDLERQFPGIRFRMIDEQDKIRPHIKFFVNKEQTFDLQTPLTAKDEVAIVQAFSGG